MVRPLPLLAVESTRAVAREAPADHGAAPDGGEETVATRAASAAARPCVTSGPSKPARRSAAMKWRKVDDAVASGGEAAIGMAVLGMGERDAPRRAGRRPRSPAPCAVSAGAVSKRLAGSSTMRIAVAAEKSRAAPAPWPRTRRHCRARARRRWRCLGARRSAAAGGTRRRRSCQASGTVIVRDDAAIDRRHRGCRCTPSAALCRSPAPRRRARRSSHGLAARIALIGMDHVVGGRQRGDADTGARRRLSETAWATLSSIALPAATAGPSRPCCIAREA